MKEHPMLYIDTATELDYIEARLKDVPEKIVSKKILKTALTAAARQARKQMVKDNKQRYALKLVSPTAADMFGRVARKPEVAELVYDMLAREVEKRIEKALE